MREIHHSYGWYDGSSKQSGGGEESMSPRHLDSDVQTRIMLREEEYYGVLISLPIYNVYIQRIYIHIYIYIYYIYIYIKIYILIKKNSITVGGPAKCRIFPPRPQIRHLFISLPFHFEGRSFLLLKYTFLFVRY